MTPVIAIVGRPNVGKSTLFNRITRSRDAIVADFAGLTRDRHYGNAHLGERRFIVVDTGGFEPTSDTGIVHEMAKQTEAAVAEADVVVFVVDARAGVSGQDHDIARFLRPTGKKVILAVNKAEGMAEGPQMGEFYELGLGEPHPVSASHGQGVRSLVEAALEGIPAAPEEARSEQDDGPIRLAVAGRPNVGKSTLINTWRKGKVFEAVEKFSVVKTLQAISDANVVLLLLDATQGVTDQDAHIAGYILESGRAVALAVNKWDAVDDYQKQTLARSIEQRLAFLRFAPVLHISAPNPQGLAPVWKAILAAHASATRKLPTPQLTRLLQEAVQHQTPKRAGGFRPKLRYAHQGGMNPPIVVIHGNSLEHVTDAYKRYLEGRIREHFRLTGTPLRIEMRSSHNPFDEKRDRG
jgi:GTPase